MQWLSAGFITHLQAKERNLERESADETLAGIESSRWSRCVLPWIPLMAGADNPDTVDRWKRLAESEPNSRLKAEYGAIAKQFAARVKRNELWNKKLEGWNVEESTVANEWIALGEARGVALGEARGVALGEAHGRLEGVRLLFRDLGTERFGSPTPSIESAIVAITDVNRLTKLVKQVSNAVSWDDLLATP